MARVQVLVQLDDDLLARIDERAVAEGISRSELVRRATRSLLCDEIGSAVDRAIAEGYRRHPADPPSASDLARAVASIDEEPW